MRRGRKINFAFFQILLTCFCLLKAQSDDSSSNKHNEDSHQVHESYGDTVNDVLKNLDGGFNSGETHSYFKGVGDFENFDELKYTTFPDSINDESDFIKYTEEEKINLEKQYNELEDEISRKVFKEIRLYERSYLGLDSFRVLCYKILSGHNPNATNQEKFYYSLIIEEIASEAPPLIPADEIDQYLVGDKFQNGVEKVMLKHFGEEGLSQYKHAIDEDL